MPRPKRTRDLFRKSPSRNARERVLVVCEGGKTEPYYLRDFAHELRLTNADIKICGEECGTDPMSVYRFALEEFKKDQDFDRVFCVFDKNRHATYNEAIAAIKHKNLPGGRTIEAIRSVPCFEFWILLHFRKTTKPYAEIQGKSTCMAVIDDLRAHLPEYVKGRKNIYRRIKENTDKAIRNAQQTKEAAEKANTDNPLTEMYILISYLRSIRTV